MKSGSDSDKNGVNSQNYGIFFNLLHDSLNVQQLLVMVSACFEFHNLSISKEQEIELNQLKGYMNYFPKNKQYTPQMIKVVFLLAAHTNRDEISKGLKKDQTKIVQACLKIINSIVEAAFMFNHMPKGKKISPNTIDLLIEFSKNIVQAVPFQSPLCSIFPELCENKLFNKFTTIQELKENLSNVKSIPVENKENILSKLEKIPEFIINANLYVDGEKDVRMGDVLTVKLKIARKHYEIESFKESLGFEKKEKIWVILGDGKKTIFLRSFDYEGNEINDSSIQLPIDRKLGFGTGKQSIDIYIKSDCYMGIDKKLTVDLTILNPLKSIN